MYVPIMTHSYFVLLDKETKYHQSSQDDASNGNIPSREELPLTQYVAKYCYFNINKNIYKQVL